MPKLVATIVVDGENIAGEMLCQVHGLVRKKRKLTMIDYEGPVTDAPVDIADAVLSLLGDA